MTPVKVESFLSGDDSRELMREAERVDKIAMAVPVTIPLSWAQGRAPLPGRFT